MRYDAFISYHKRTEGRLAEALQDALEHLIKPWYRRRPFLRICRDDKALAPGADLAASINERLDQAGHLVLLVSPESAASPWVDKEVERWIDRDGVTNIVPVIAGYAGGAAADLAAFDWAGDDVSPTLRGRLTEPLYVDMRWARAPDADLTLANPDFERDVIRVAAAIRDQGPDEFIGALVAMQTRARILTGTIALAVAILLGGIVLSLLGLFAAQRRIADADAELADINVLLAEREDDLADADAELAAANDELASARAAVDAADAQLQDALNDLTRAESDLTSTQGELDAANAAVDTAEQNLADARDAEARALSDLELAEAERNRVQGELDAAASELSGTRDQLAGTRDELAGTQNELGRVSGELNDTNGKLTTANKNLTDVTADRDAIAKVEEAVSLAVASNLATSSGDAALGLVLALESGLTTDAPIAPAYSALVAARGGMASNPWQVVGGTRDLLDTPDRAVIESVDGGFDAPEARVDALAVRPDGHLVVAWTDGRVDAVDPETFRSEPVFRAPPREGWYYDRRLGEGVPLWLAADGTRFAHLDGEPPGRLVVRDATDGSLIAATTVYGRPVYDVAFAPTGVVIQSDGLELIEIDWWPWYSVADGAGFYFWDMTDSPPWQLWQGDEQSDHTLGGVTSDGRVVAASFTRLVEFAGDASLDVLNEIFVVPSTPGDVVRRFELDDDVVLGGLLCLRVEPTGDSAVLADGTGLLRAFDLSDGSVSDGPQLAGFTAYDLGRHRSAECGPMLTWQPGRQEWTTASVDGVVRSWSTGGVEQTGTTYRARSRVSNAAFDEPTGRLFLHGEAVGSISVVLRRPAGSLAPTRTWDAPTGSWVVAVPGTDLTAFVDGDLITYHDNRTLQPVWQVSNDFTLGVLQHRLTIGRRHVAFSGGDWVLADRQTGTNVRIPYLAEDVAVAPVADILAVLDEDRVDLFALPTDGPAPRTGTGVSDVAPLDVGVPLTPLGSLTGLPLGATTVRLSPDGNLVAVAGAAELTVFDRRTGSRHLEPFAAGAPIGPELVLSDDYVVMADGSTLWVWDLDSGAVVIREFELNVMRNIALSADQRLLSVDGGRSIWQLPSGERLSGVAADLDIASSGAWLGGSHRLLVLGSNRGRYIATIWDTLDPDAACALAVPYLDGRTVADHLPRDRTPKACVTPQ